MLPGFCFCLLRLFLALFAETFFVRFPYSLIVVFFTLYCTVAAFVPSSVVTTRTVPVPIRGFSCCVGVVGCGHHTTRLFMSEEAAASSSVVEVVPPEVAALEGIESSDEAHNAARPARESIAKKKSNRKALSEFTKGETITAKVKSITSYGAFMDIGATTDGLLHISNLSAEFVQDVASILKEGDEKQVRIMNIDEKKGQVQLTLLTEEEEAAAKDRPARGGGGGQQQNRSGGQQQQNRGGGGGGRRDDSAVVNAVAQKGFDSTLFVEGTVVSTVDFGAFVRLDASKLNSEVEGEMDGLVHISALKAGRADSVTSVVNVGDKVQVRCLAIDGPKVSLSMVSVQDAQEAAERRQAGGGGNNSGDRESVPQGAKDWQESLDRIRLDLPEFHNGPLVVDLRK
jgi:predicted RNA-binding protein with RPS1 domain